MGAGGLRGDPGGGGGPAEAELGEGGAEAGGSADSGGGAERALSFPAALLFSERHQFSSSAVGSHTSFLGQ
jgi:hypothetical protein